jgi:hypothetical protein
VYNWNERANKVNMINDKITTLITPAPVSTKTDTCRATKIIQTRVTKILVITSINL